MCTPVLSPRFAPRNNPLQVRRPVPCGAIEARGIDPEVISDVIEAIRAPGAC